MNSLRNILWVMFALGGSSCWGADGQALFNENCAVCHQRDGVGSPGLAPPLADKALWDRLGADAPRYIGGVMLAGLSGTIETDGAKYSSLVMPSQARLTDDEIALIGTYVLSVLNGSRETLSTATVTQLRASPVSHKTLRNIRRVRDPG